MIVVSDTSPVLNLARIGCLELLASLYKKVLVPPAVHAELSFPQSDPAPVSVDLASIAWLTVVAPKDAAHVRRLSEDLDSGEAEAIVLALECQADLVLIDERRGRKIATSLGLTVTGLLGVLADAKNAGLIVAAKPTLDRLIEEARFWVGPDLYRAFLAELGES